MKLEGDEKEFDIQPMPLLVGDEEEVKEWKGLNIFTINKLLTKLPLFLAQIKTGYNSYKLKNRNQTNTLSLASTKKLFKKQFNQVIITMRVHVRDNKVIITAEPKTFYFDLTNNVDNNLKHEIDSLKIMNFQLSIQWKARLEKDCPNTSMETIFMSMENSKTNEPHKFYSTYHRDYV